MPVFKIKPAITNTEALRILIEAATLRFPYANPSDDPDKHRREWHKQVLEAIRIVRQSQQERA